MTRAEQSRIYIIFITRASPLGRSRRRARGCDRGRHYYFCFGEDHFQKPANKQEAERLSLQIPQAWSNLLIRADWCYIPGKKTFDSAAGALPIANASPIPFNQLILQKTGVRRKTIVSVSIAHTNMTNRGTAGLVRRSPRGFLIWILGNRRNTIRASQTTGL